MVSLARGPRCARAGDPERLGANFDRAEHDARSGHSAGSLIVLLKVLRSYGRKSPLDQ